MQNIRMDFLSAQYLPKATHKDLIREPKSKTLLRTSPQPKRSSKSQPSHSPVPLMMKRSIFIKISRKMAHIVCMKKEGRLKD